MTALPAETAPVAALPPAAAPAIGVDFDRPLVSILGLPFDAIDLAEAVRRIRAAAFSGHRCFVSTPNLNFAMAARADVGFRGSVLRSDMSLVDGMPLVWIARFLGLPVPERVSGADVFEALLEHPGPKLDVYLFGGPPGAASLAAGSINRRGGGVRCVGFETPGFGSIESMSGEEQLARINRSGAHFIAVSLGAVKGQAWIERNAARLQAPVISHLGAVVNFAAGTVSRAPGWMQSSGLEWLWRVRQEPALWRRYANDAAALAGPLLTQVLPDAIDGWRWRAAGRPESPPARLDAARSVGVHTLSLIGDWRRADAASTELRAALARAAAEAARLRLDLSSLTAAGSTTIALLMVARGWFEAHGGFEVTGETPRLRAVLRRKLAAAAVLGGDR